MHQRELTTEEMWWLDDLVAAQIRKIQELLPRAPPDAQIKLHEKLMKLEFLAVKLQT